ncbi:MAG TPA: hypothetical protein G4N96_07600 [Chloroflexi bacterium]|nr:hypothetical protein [Chloroflexota bacterium]
MTVLVTRKQDAPKRIKMMTVELFPQVGSILDSVVGVGETPTQKITHLLLSEIHRHLEACEREQLELEIAYGLEYADFERKLEAGDLGNEFEYEIEMDALRWSDLIVEKKYWLHQLNQLKGLLK